jgi:heptosyltransferase I
VTADSAPAARPRVLVVRLGAMGDIIHTLPAVAQLRRAFPESEIGWLVEERWSELLFSRTTPRSGHRTPTRPLVEFVHTVNTKAWRRSLLGSHTRQQIRTVLQQVRRQRYDIAIDFQGAIKSAILARLSNAATVVGMEHPREKPARFLYKRRVLTAGTHVVEQYRSVAHVIGSFASAAASGDQSTEELLPRDPEAETAVEMKLAKLGRRFALINPGAGWGAKQWPADRYGMVARELARLGLAPLINVGPGEEELAEAVEASSEGLAHRLHCSIAELIALMRRATIFIGGDTGPLHLAAALGIPVVALFGPTDPARNGPYATKSIVLRSPASETSLSHTSVPDAGLQQITADQVIAAVRRLIEETDA